MATSLFQGSVATKAPLLSETQVRMLRHAEEVRIESERVSKEAVLLAEFMASLVSAYRPPTSMDGLLPGYRTPLVPVFEYKGSSVNAIIGDYLQQAVSMLAFARRYHQVLFELIQALKLGGDGSGSGLQQILERLSKLEGEVLFMDGEIDGVAQDRDFAAEFQALLNT